MKTILFIAHVLLICGLGLLAVLLHILPLERWCARQITDAPVEDN